MNTWSKKVAFGAATLAVLNLSPIALAQTAPSMTTSAGVTATVTVAPRAFVRLLKVTAMNGNIITAIGPDANTFTVDATNATIIRKFGAASSMEEMSVGDMIWAKGTIPAAGSTDVTATKIRNMSVHKWHSIVAGYVQSVTSTGFVFEDYGKTTYTITVTPNTVYKNNTDNTFTGLCNVMVGDRIRTYGLIDTVAMTETADAVRLVYRNGTMTGTGMTQQTTPATPCPVTTPPSMTQQSTMQITTGVTAPVQY